MYIIIHVGFGVRSFPPEHLKMKLILQKKKTKQKKNKKEGNKEDKITKKQMMLKRE